MSLEDAINELVSAVKANTAALKGGSAGGSEKASKPENKPAGKAAASGSKKSKHTVEEVCALLQKIKQEHGASEAKSVINDAGFEKMVEITAADADKVFQLATEKLEELEGGAEGDEDGI